MSFKSDRPFARAGQVIGLLGGSFDPPHQGHVHLTKTALTRCQLDQVWWMVSPGNPLKPDAPADLGRRLRACRAIMDHPRVKITDIEAQFSTRYTAQTLDYLAQLYRGVRFVWLMGEDNLANFHRWERWPSIIANAPIGVFARPGQHLPARLTHAARLYRWARLPEAQAPLLGRTAPPAWCHINMPKQAVSSTAIRAKGDWER
ncbi:MAG: nicotinate-nucleotide adenylyltransferase [Mangrovicoccus sp.]